MTLKLNNETLSILSCPQKLLWELNEICIYVCKLVQKRMLLNNFFSKLIPGYES